MTILDRLNSLYPNVGRTGLEDYLVEDCGCGPDLKVVLVCESPHREEVESDHRLPLVGKSGKSVTRVLVEFGLCQETSGSRSIGELVSGDRTNFNWLGLMNACQLPMQKKVYSDDLQQRHELLLGKLERIRKGKCLSSVQALECLITDDLAERWASVRCRAHREPLVIACGETARRLCSLANLPADPSLHTPHPSRNQWGMALELYKTITRIEERMGNEN